MKIIQLVIAAFLISFLVACDRSSGNVPALVEPTSDISLIVEQTKAPVERTATATRRPTNKPPILSDEISDVSATPTSTPTLGPPPPTLVPEPISTSGPWLLLSGGTTYTGAMPVIDPVIINFDGTGWEYLNIPHPPDIEPNERHWWYGDFPPNIPYIAIRGYASEYYLNCVKDAISPTTQGQFDYYLYIIKLPENKVVNKFRLLGLQAEAQILKDNCTLKGDDAPTVWGVTSLSINVSWSPDGRLMAFSAAPDGPSADLYLYDTQTDTFRRLTHHQNNPHVLGWSPDGKTIIYQAVSEVTSFKDQILKSSGLYAVSISGTDRLLYKTKKTHAGLQWLSQSHFIITDALCTMWTNEDCKGRVLLFDLSNGKSEEIFEGDLLMFRFSADPINHLLLLSHPTLPGLLYFDLETRSLNPVPLEEGFPFPYWDAKLQLFRYKDNDFDPPYTQHNTLLRFSKADGFIVEKVDNMPDHSPDGRWKVITEEEKKFIQDAQGRNIQELSKGGSCGWSPNSSTYIQLIEKPEEAATWVMVYQKENNWQPIVTRKIPEGYLMWCKWISP